MWQLRENSCRIRVPGREAARMEMKKEGTHIGGKMPRTYVGKEPKFYSSRAQNFSVFLHCLLKCPNLPKKRQMFYLRGFPLIVTKNF